MKPTVRMLPSLTLLALAGMANARQSDDALTRELLADAGVRASFQAASTAGHDGKFFLASADGGNRLNITGKTQVRYHLNFRDTMPPDKDLTNGFNARRMELGFEGVVAGEWEYKIVGAFSRSSGAFDLDDATLSRKFDNGLDLTWGQFRPQFLREENISSGAQLAVDTSPMNAVFNQGRSQGLELRHTGEEFRFSGMFSDGFNAKSTAYYSTAEADIALTGRADFRFGDASWKAFKDFTSFREGPVGGLVGAAVHWQTSGQTANTRTFAGTAATDTDLFTYTLDASYEGGGWNLYGAFVGRNIDTAGGPGFDDFGALLQGGAFVTETTELFARWDAVFADDSRAAGQDFHTLTFGANHYFFPGSHAAKLTADVQWFLDDQVGSGDVVMVNEGIGLAPTSQDDQISLRIQMQLLF